MENKLRIKRIKEAIKQLEEGSDPRPKPTGGSYKFWLEVYGLESEEADLLVANRIPVKYFKKGFKDGDVDDLPTMLHNWKRFLELIEELEKQKTC